MSLILCRYSVIEVDAELQTVRVTEGLTEDAIYARLHEGGLAPPLFVHSPGAGVGTDRRLREATVEGEWEQRVGTVFRTQVGAVQRYDDPDPVAGMLDRVMRQLNLPPDTRFTQVRGRFYLFFSRPFDTTSSYDRPFSHSLVDVVGILGEGQAASNNFQSLRTIN